MASTYILPDFWAPALINDDYSGMSDNDIKELESWYLKEMPGNCVMCSEHPYFSRHNDAGTLACNVLEYSFLNF